MQREGTLLSCFVLVSIAVLGAGPALAQLNRKNADALRQRLGENKSVVFETGLQVLTIDLEKMRTLNYRVQGGDVSVKVSLKAAQSEAVAVRDGKLALSWAEGEPRRLRDPGWLPGLHEFFLEVRNTGDRALTAYAIQFADPPADAVMLAGGVAVVDGFVGVPDFVGTFRAPRGAVVQPRRLDVDCLGPLAYGKEIPPGGVHRVLQLSDTGGRRSRQSPVSPPDAGSVQVVALLYADGTSDGDPAVIAEMVQARKDLLAAISSAREFLANAGLGRADWKAVDKKINQVMGATKKGNQIEANGSPEMRELLHAVREAVGRTNEKAGPQEAEAAAKSLLDSLEASLKQSKPA